MPTLGQVVSLAEIMNNAIYDTLTWLIFYNYLKCLSIWDPCLQATGFARRTFLSVAHWCSSIWYCRKVPESILRFYFGRQELK